MRATFVDFDYLLYVLSFDFERTQWRLSQKSAVRIIFYTYVFITITG
jgi:hypothetical protein